MVSIFRCAALHTCYDELISPEENTCNRYKNDLDRPHLRNVYVCELFHLLNDMPSRSSPRICGEVKEVRVRQGSGATDPES
jgi:hypothetical protein